jgi:hypothetical protein
MLPRVSPQGRKGARSPVAHGTLIALGASSGLERRTHHRHEEVDMFRRLATLIIGIGLATVAVPSGIVGAVTCSAPLPQNNDQVVLDPADFVERIDNPYLPMPPGTRWTYRETEPEGTRQRVDVSVTTRTREILGIAATVVHDKATEHGELVENTFDWYAQDACGNVWYLGENTKEYEEGVVVSTAGSWEAGVDGAQAGVVMPADPQVGLTYRQEYLAGEAEDAQVPFGHFRDAVLVKEFTPLHPRVLEYKLYAKGVGMVLAIAVSGGSDREELVRMVPSPA